MLTFAFQTGYFLSLLWLHFITGYRCHHEAEHCKRHSRCSELPAPRSPLLTVAALGITECGNKAHHVPTDAPAARTGHCTGSSDAVGATRDAYAAPAAPQTPSAARLSKPEKTAGTPGVVVRSSQPRSGSRSPPRTSPAEADPEPHKRYSRGLGAKTSSASRPRPGRSGSDGPRIARCGPHTRARRPGPAHPSPLPLGARPLPGPAPRRRAAGPSHPPLRSRSRAGAGRPSEGAWPQASTRARALAPYGYVSGHVTPTPKVPREATGR